MIGKPVYLFVTPFFPSPDGWRGAFCFDLAQALIADGRYDVHVFTPGGTDDYTLNGVTVHRFPWRMLPSGILPFLYRRGNIRRFMARVREVGVLPEQIEVVHVHTALFMQYAVAVKRINPACKALLHHWDPQSFGLNLGRLRHFWPHKLLLFCQLRRMHDAMDAHVFISERVEQNFRTAPRCVERYYDDYRRQMRGLGWMRSACVKHAIRLYNGVDTKLFHPPANSTAEDGVLRIGCVANFVSWKDQITLVKAVEILRDHGSWNLDGNRRVHVKFVGSGPTFQSCKEYIISHKLDEYFTFVCEMRHEELPNFYHSIDLFVLPSYFEGFGSVFTEAWASGRPFITCEGQAMDDLLSEVDRQRWTFPPRDPKALAERIAPMLQPDADWSIPKLVRDVRFSQTIPEFLSAIDDINLGAC